MVRDTELHAAIEDLMKSWLRHLVGLTGLFTACSAPAGELLLDSWRQEIDQNVIHVLGENSGGDGLLLLAKEFLDSAWGDRYAERLNSEEYKLVDSTTAASVSLFTADRSDNIEVGKSFYVNDNYVIPVVKLNATVELYEYSPASSALEVISLALDPAAMRIESAFALSGGVVVVSSKGSSVAATYYPYDAQQERVALDVGINPLRISDVIEVGGRIYVLAIVRSETNPNSSNPLVTVFDQSGLGESVAEIAFAEYAAAIVTSGFIPTADPTPSIWTTQNDSITEPSRLSVVDLNGAEVWSSMLDAVGAIANIDLVEACSDKYVYGEIQTSDPPARRHIELSLATPASDLTFLDNSFLPRESGTITGLHFYPSDKAIYVITNYKQYEETRRSDGFYGWHGFNVFEISKDESCNLDV